MARRPTFQTLEPRLLLAAYVRINEFVADNEGSLLDGDGNNSDWIEIHNAGEQTVDLSGWHLTDNRADLDKWPFPSVPLAPGEYLVVFASGQPGVDYVDTAGYRHTNFRLAADGEYLALVDNTQTIVSQFAPTYPQQFEDISYGLGQKDDQLLYFDSPTPGSANGTGYPDVTRETVAFSRTSGTFVDGFSLTITSEAPGKAIYYTLDRSLPTSESKRYDGPISIESTVELRARVIEPGHVPGPVNTESYLRLGPDVADFRSQLPIMVLENFGAGRVPDKGWNQTGTGIRQVPRQPGSLLLFERRGAEASLLGQADLASRMGIRVRGASSSDFPEPPYSLETWSDQRDDDFDITPFGMGRDSDWVLYAPNPSRDWPLIKNAFSFRLSQQIGRWAPQFQFVEAFVNTDGGDVTMRDYEGLYLFHEKVSRGPSRLDFPRLSADARSGGWLLGINRMDPISEEGRPPKNFHTPGPDGILQTRPDLSRGSSSGDDIPRQYNAYINFDDPSGYDINPIQRQAIETWMSDMENVLYGRTNVVWNDPVDGYARYIDVRSFIDHYLLQNFTKHSDALLLSMWIYNPNPSGGGKLQFGPIWDVDLGGFEGTATADLFYRSDQLWYDRLFDDPHFVQQYIDRWQELRSGAFSDQNLYAIIDAFFAEIGTDAAARDRVTRWDARLDRMKQWVAARAAAFDAAFVPRPTLSHDGGNVPAGFELSMASPLGDIYYTLDGTDPRLPDGTISLKAIRAGKRVTPWVAAGANATALVPTASLDQTIGQTWIGAPEREPFDDSAWLKGTTGIGYDTTGNYQPLIGLPLDGRPVSVYARIEFQIEGPVPAYDSLTLDMQYDDGFVAYLNGQEIARDRTWSGMGEPPAFNERARRSHTADVTRFVSFDVTDKLPLLREGTNVLALHGLNVSENNSDMLIRPELVAGYFASAAITITTTTQVKTRVLDEGRWSGLVETTFVVTNDPPFVLGDSNHDGMFDSSDLVQVWQAGEYEDDVQNNSTYEEGDWNGDGDFTTADFLFVFKAGTLSRAAMALALSERSVLFAGAFFDAPAGTPHGAALSAPAIPAWAEWAARRATRMMAVPAGSIEIT